MQVDVRELEPVLGILGSTCSSDQRLVYVDPLLCVDGMFT